MRAFPVCLTPIVLSAMLSTGELATAQVKISSLPAASALAGGELLPAVQGGADVAVTSDQIKTFTGSGGTVISGDPGANVGLSAVNGVATTFMRSDAAPALSQAISPTWTGAHAFNGAFGGSAVAAYLASPPAIGGATPGTGSFSSLTDTGVTGSTQCLQVNSSGVVAGSGGACGGSLGAQGANTVLANFTGSGAAPTANTVPSCSGAGNYLQYTSASGFQCLKPAAPLKVTPTNPSALATSSAQMLGIGSTATITPAATGRVMITVSGDDTDNGTAAIEHIQLLYGTGTAPSNGAAQSGTAAGNSIQSKTTAGYPTPFSITWVATGLTLSTAYWIDLSIYNSAAGSTVVQDLSVTAVEF